MKITVIEPNVSDLMKVAADVRLGDRVEWSAGTGTTFLVSAKATITVAEYKRAAIDEDGTPLCFWGHFDGDVWLFATEKAERVAISLHRKLKGELDKMFEDVPVLTASAYSKNTKHLEWLRWLGFEEQGEIPLGPDGQFFTVFKKERPTCA